MFTKFNNLPVFIISFIVGLLFIHLSTTETKTVFVYPTPDNIEHIEYIEMPQPDPGDYIDHPVFCDDDVYLENIYNDHYYLRDGVRLHDNEYQFYDIEGLDRHYGFYQDYEYFGISDERSITRLEFKFNDNEDTEFWLNVEKKNSIEKVLKAIFQD